MILSSNILRIRLDHSSESELKTLILARTLIGLTSLSFVLLLLLILTLGCLCYSMKTRNTTKAVVKTDVNPVYGIEDNPELSETYDYMG